MEDIDKKKKKRKYMTRGPCNHHYDTRFRLRSATLSSRTFINSLHQVLVSCERRRDVESNSPYLSNDVIFSILVFLPAKVLCDVMRYVCWECYHIIKGSAFVTTHLQVSSSGILVQNRKNLCEAIYIESNGVGLEITNLRLPIPAPFHSPCDGFVLLQDQTDPRFLHVVNLVNKSGLSLPRLDWLKPAFYGFKRRVGTLACTSDGRYKVVCAVGFIEVQVLICTVGYDDHWRVLDVEHVIPNRKKWVLAGSSLSIAGVIYWFGRDMWCFYALDVDTEIMYTFPIPKGYFRSLWYRVCVSLEKTICLVEYFTNYSLKFWKLTDIKSGEWNVAFEVDMKPITSRLDHNKFGFEGGLSCLPLICSSNGEIWFSFYSRVDTATAIYVLTDIRRLFMFLRPCQQLTTSAGKSQVTAPVVHYISYPDLINYVGRCSFTNNYAQLVSRVKYETFMKYFSIDYFDHVMFWSWLRMCGG